MKKITRNQLSPQTQKTIRELVSTLEGAGVNVCEIVNNAIPILKKVMSIFFFNHKWKDKIDQAITLLALLCPKE